MTTKFNQLKLVKLGIDTLQEFIIYMRSDSIICKSEGFESLARIVVTFKEQSIIATVNMVRSNLLKESEASLSESAWEELGVHESDIIQVSHLLPVASVSFIHSKIYGNILSASQFTEIITDIVAGKYSNIHLSSFITACGSNKLGINEIIDLTKAMVEVGEQLHWGYPIVLDKHSVGGIPGNRTTPIVVAIVAAAGLIIPKTSSRAITSPAGTADTVETMTEVNLTVAKIREVVDREGGCMAWGGSIGLSPADDIIIRVERVLDFDPMGQMIASVLSKKVAVGASHILIDVPVGPTAKIRSDEEFSQHQEYFAIVGKALGVHVEVLKTNGTQPLGKGIGPALEAKDILAVLRNEPKAPIDLKNKAIVLAGILLEFGKKAPPKQGAHLARQLLEQGLALNKFLAICEAQGGFKEPKTASLTCEITAKQKGIVTEIDNRNLAKVAKLAGAPNDATAGIEFFAKIGTLIEKGQTLFKIHSESKGALDYSCQYALSMPDIVKLKPQ
jgi:thymidine phosphorylase